MNQRQFTTTRNPATGVRGGVLYLRSRSRWIAADGFTGETLAEDLRVLLQPEVLDGRFIRPPRDRLGKRPAAS